MAESPPFLVTWTASPPVECSQLGGDTKPGIRVRQRQGDGDVRRLGLSVHSVAGMFSISPGEIAIR